MLEDTNSYDPIDAYERIRPHLVLIVAVALVTTALILWLRLSHG